MTLWHSDYFLYSENDFIANQFPIGQLLEDLSGCYAFGTLRERISEPFSGRGHRPQPPRIPPYPPQGEPQQP